MHLLTTTAVGVCSLVTRPSERLFTQTNPTLVVPSAPQSRAIPRLPKRTDPAATVEMLGEQAEIRQEELEKYEDLGKVSESDDGQRSDCPILDKCFEKNGNHAIMDMTNFTVNEFM